MDAATLGMAQQHFYAPRYEIEAGGRDVVGAGAAVVSVSVDENLEAGASRMTLTVLNEGLRWLTSPLLAPGTEVTVRLGYVEPLPVLFEGEITELRPTFPADGASQLEVAAHDFSHRLSRGCRFKPWEEVTDSDIARQIAARHHLDPSGVKATTVTYPKIMQDGETDLAFLRRRARRIDYEVAVRGRTLMFDRPQDEASAPEVVTLTWGESLITFTPELNTSGQVSDVSVRGWGPAAKREILGRASWRDVAGGGGDRVSGGALVEQLYGPVEDCVRDEPVYTQAEADQRARAALKERSDRFIRGSGECVGIPQIRARTAVRLEGLGPFSMTYYVLGAIHTIGSGGYRTSFTVKGENYARPR
jgi:phage protein D